MQNLFNVTFGNNNNSISEKDIKAGIRKDDLKDDKMKSIFDKLDNGNGILEEPEIEKIKMQSKRQLQKTEMLQT